MGGYDEKYVGHRNIIFFLRMRKKMVRNFWDEQLNAWIYDLEKKNQRQISHT